MDKNLFSEYDFILCLDRSGSMETRTKNFPSRWAEAKEMTLGIARFAAEVDDDGITVITFGGAFDPKRDVIDGVKADAVEELFRNHRPGGSTPLDQALNAAFMKHAASGKKAIIVVITDGEPNQPQAVGDAIIAKTKTLKDASHCRVLFVQIGDDRDAERYLDGLDNSLQGAAFDIVNAVTFTKADGLSTLDLMTRAVEDSH